MDEKVRKRRWGRQPAYPLDCTAGFPVHASDEEEAALERQNIFLHRIYIAISFKHKRALAIPALSRNDKGFRPL